MITVRQQRHGSVLHIQLNRPEKRNALNDQMFDELSAVAEEARADTTLGAVVVSGAGRSFCAGLDFETHRAVADEGAAGERPYADPNDPTSRGRRVPGRGQRIVRALRNNPVPVIAALHGHAIGGGLQIALGADIRIATDDVVLCAAEIEFGMTLDMGGTQLLPRLIGSDQALALITTGVRVSGVQASALGLVTRLSEEPVVAALALAEVIAGRSPNAVRQTKRLVRLSESATLEAGMVEELSVMAANIGSADQVKAAQQYLGTTKNRSAATTI